MSNTSPLSDALINIFGGSGFIGKYATRSLLDRGARVRIASRDPHRAAQNKGPADRDQLEFVRCDITKDEDLKTVLDGCDYVVNLVGAFDGDLRNLMGEAPGRIAEIASANAVQALVHVSAIGADPNSPTAYAKGKALGEQLIMNKFPKATILRPSIVFGKDDNFLNMFGQLIKMIPVLPVFGPDAQLQLVYVEDIAEAIAVALENSEEHGGHIFELGGPDVLTMMEINQRIADAQGRKRGFIPVPDGVSGVFASLPGTPMSRDQWILLKQGSTVSDQHKKYSDLGIEPRPLNRFLAEWMANYS